MKKLFSLMLLLATMISFTACGGDDRDEPISISQKNYEIFAGETAVAQGTGLNNLSWESSNKFVANIESGATIQAYKVGWTTISSKDVSGYLNVIVNPKVTIYSEPLIRQHCKWINGQIVVEDWLSQYIWGTHKSLMSHLIKEAGIPWTLTSNQSDMQMYSTGNSATPYIGYLFNDDGRMNATCIYMKPSYAAKLFDFIEERFVIYSVDKLNYTADFAHARIDYNDEVTINYIGRVGASSSTGYILIMYYADINNARSVNTDNLILNRFEQAILRNSVK